MHHLSRKKPLQYKKSVRRRLAVKITGRLVAKGALCLFYKFEVNELLASGARQYKKAQAPMKAPKSAEGNSEKASFAFTEILKRLEGLGTGARQYKKA